MSRTLFRVLMSRFSPGREPEWSRRDLLRGGLVAAGALALGTAPGCAARPRSGGALDGPRPDGKGRRVVVVGAGFAGLSCAHELVACGCEVTVLEARSRVSGRVVSFSDLLAGAICEGGGEFIGANHPTWQAYAKRFKLPLARVEEEEHMPIILGGRKLSEAEAEELWEAMVAVAALMNAEAAAVPNFNPYEPWKAKGAMELDKTSLGAWLESKKGQVPELGLRGMGMSLAADNGMPIEEQSYLGMLSLIGGGGGERFWSQSEEFRCAGGNQQLAIKLAEAVGLNRVLTGRAVKTIQSDESGVRVTDAAGERHEGDHVVIAVPPSVWDQIDCASLRRPGYSMQMGAVLKSILVGPVSAWKATGPGMFSDGPIALTWEQAVEQAGAGRGESRVRQGALGAFTSGARANALADLPEEECHRRVIEAVAVAHPGVANAPIRQRFMNWPRDPRAMAGYSFPAPGQVTTVLPRLRAGFANVAFAGEHTSSAFAGYMEGALESGIRAARKVLTQPVAAASR